MAKEIWKCINDYDCLYKISNLGRVKSFNDKGIRILKLETLKQGYKRVTLSKKGKTKRVSVHRLVASHFLKNEFNKPCVNHINGVKYDNRLENLQWCSYSENEKHSYNILGKENNNRKLKLKDVIYIRKNYVKGVNKDNRGNSKMLVKKYNVSLNTILNIAKNKYYV